MGLKGSAHWEEFQGTAPDSLGARALDSSPSPYLCPELWGGPILPHNDYCLFPRVAAPDSTLLLRSSEEVGCMPSPKHVGYLF